MKVSRMTDQLIKHLVSDLKSLEPLINSKLWMHCTVCLLIMAGIVLAMMGLRADYPTAIQDGAMLWKPGIFLLAWIGSMLLILDLSRPIERIEKWHFVPLFLAGTILLWQMIVQLPYLFSSDATLSLNDPNAIYCLSVIIGGGGIAMAMSWKFWFSRTASPNPTTLGALAGFSVGCLAATGYALHCDKDGILYLFIYYGTPILILSVIGSLLSKRLLKW